MKYLIKYKKYIINIVLFFMILIIASIPIFLSNLQKQNLLGKVSTQPIENQKPVESDSKQVEDKLSLIVNYRKKDKNIVLIEKTENQIKNTNISPLIINEFKKLQDIGVFPKINLDNNKSLYEYSLKTYMDKNSPQNFVTIMEGVISDPNYDLYFCMDSKTLKIYEFSVSSYTNFSKMDLSNISNSLESYFGVKWYKKGIDEFGYNSKLFYLNDGDIIFYYSSDERYVQLSLRSVYK